MQSTLEYQIRQTQARLAITNLRVSSFPQAPIVSFCIENDGHAMADYIDVDNNRFSGRTTRDLSPYGPAPGPITWIHASPSGASLGEGKTNCDYRVPIHQTIAESKIVTFADIAAGKPDTGFWIQVIVAYRDTATEQTFIASSCVCWLGSPWNYFSPCISPTLPTKEQHSSVTR
jgi:hypothetical protein